MKSKLIFPGKIIIIILMFAVTTYSQTNTLEFATKIDFTAGISPTSMCISDIDGDTKFDLVAANLNNNTVSVLRNTSAGGIVSFASKVDFITGNNPRFVSVRDIDGDGKLDIAVANYNSNTVSLFRNTSTSGNISFESKVDINTGLNPRSLSIGDIDGDRKLDLAVTNENSNSVSVFLNTSVAGTLSFAPKSDFTTGLAPLSVSIGDINTDGKPDLAVANSSGNSFSVFRNISVQGNISFAAREDFTNVSGSYAIKIGDLDGDNKGDITVSNYSSNSISIYHNTSSTGSLSFSAMPDLFTGITPTNLSIDDLDGDGRSEIAVTNSNSSTVSVFRNNSAFGAISFSVKSDFGTGNDPHSVCIGDIDGDNIPDLTSANRTDNDLSILKNLTVPFSPAQDSLTSLQHINSHIMIKALLDGYYAIQNFDRGIDSTSTFSWTGAYTSGGWTGSITGILYNESLTLNFTGSTVFDGNNQNAISVYQGSGMKGADSILHYGTATSSYDAATGKFTTMNFKDSGAFQGGGLEGSSLWVNWLTTSTDAIVGGTIGGLISSGSGFISGAQAGLAFGKFSGSFDLQSIPSTVNGALSYIPKSDESVTRVLGDGSMSANIANLVQISGNWANGNISGGKGGNFENNLLLNGKFSDYSYGTSGNIFPNGTSHIDPWYASRSTPELMVTEGFSGDTGWVHFNGHRTTGEVLSQSDLNIISGHIYKISICVRLAPNRPISANYGRIGVSFTNGGTTNYPPIPGTYPENYNGLIIGGNAPTFPQISSPGITDTGWVNYTYQWIATGNFNTIHFNPVNDNTGTTSNLSWMDIDNANITEIQTTNSTCLITLIPEGFYNSGINKLNRRDTVTAFLRNNTSPYGVVDSAKAIIDSLTFSGNFNFINFTDGLYFIQVKHRNSIETWSKYGVQMTVGYVNSYNFTASANMANGNNLKQVNASPVRFAIFSGDVNQDGIIDAGDLSQVENEVSESLSGYVSSDLNGDYFADASDISFIENNVAIGVSVVTP